MPNRFDKEGVINGSASCLVVEALPGARVDRTCEELAAVATALDRPMAVRHNDRTICAEPGDSGEKVLNRFNDAYSDT